MWAEAVKNDCTFLVIHSGVYEIIGVRCRKTQTLYLSDLIHPWERNGGGSYGQLHVGLFIAILRDAMGRACHVQSVDKPISSPVTSIFYMAIMESYLVLRSSRATSDFFS